ncbi:MAG: hypothetical protein ACOC83_05830 [Gemmatimonadota bacterium]
MSDDADPIDVEASKDKYLTASESVSPGGSASVDLELVWDDPFDEDCIDVDPGNVTVEENDQGDRQVVDGPALLMTFDEQQDAERARDAVQFYEFANVCFVARPDAPMEYGLR